MEKQAALDRWFLRQDIIEKLVAVGEDTDSASVFSDRIMALAALEEAEYQTLSDPFDRSVALVFSLVQEEQFNAWSIDLESFLREFTIRVKKEAETLDLPACGRLIRMSWEVLHYQSSALFDKIQYVEEEYEDEEHHFTWQDEYVDDAYIFTQTILEGKGEEFLPQFFDSRVRRQEGRNVTLAELLAAFKDAADDADMIKQRDEIRLLNKAELDQYLNNVDGRIHNEDLEGDIHRSWQAIRTASQHSKTTKVSIDEVIVGLCEGIEENEDSHLEAKISAFVSGLFLTHRGFISVSQDSESEPIYFEDLHPTIEDFEQIQELTKSLMDDASEEISSNKTGQELYLEKLALRAEEHRLKDEKRRLKERTNAEEETEESILDEDWLVE
jgi:chromatin segregation and condensation protein Rec8/ScpA/Scc1 (kleisin family)